MMKSANGWHGHFYRALRLFTLHRVRIAGKERLPGHGAVVYAVLHRNGAVDWLPCTALDPAAVPTLSSQWGRHPVARFLVNGIEFVRAKDREKDGARVSNEEAFSAARDHLAGGGRLLMFPEGTSDLGPRRLPLRPGIGTLVLDAVHAGITVHVVPVGLHYRDPVAWQCDVDVWVGDAKVFAAGSALQHADVMARIAVALDNVGINAPSPEVLARIEALATLAGDGSAADRMRLLRHFAGGIPPEIDIRADEVLTKARDLRHVDGIPALLDTPLLPTMASLSILLPLEGIAAFINMPALIAGRWAARHLPDARNVVAMWRGLVSFTVFICWQLVLFPALTASGHAGMALVAAVVSLTGIRHWSTCRRLSAGLFNRLLHPEATMAMMRFREELRATTH